VEGLYSKRRKKVLIVEELHSPLEHSFITRKSCSKRRDQRLIVEGLYSKRRKKVLIVEELHSPLEHSFYHARDLVQTSQEGFNRGRASLSVGT
jgi:hypothetical protein